MSQSVVVHNGNLVASGRTRRCIVYMGYYSNPEAFIQYHRTIAYPDGATIVNTRLLYLECVYACLVSSTVGVLVPILPFLLVAAPIGLTPNPEHCGPMIASTTKREQPCTGNEQKQPWDNSGKGGGSEDRILKVEFSVSCIIVKHHRLVSTIFWLCQTRRQCQCTWYSTAGSKRVGGDVMTCIWVCIPFSMIYTLCRRIFFYSRH